MSVRTDLFYENPLYKLLTQPSMYSLTILDQLNRLLHQQPELVKCTHRKEGSFYHIICRNCHSQDKIAFRMIYALSNAGADPNIPDGEGNTPLHEALIRGLPHCGFDIIQALFRVGVDHRTRNYYGKKADVYLANNSQIKGLYQSYGHGIWAAVEQENLEEIERLMKDFIQPNCKHNSNKTLLDKARDSICSSLIEILAKYQVTTEFLHSILACDWQRASLIYEHQNQFLQINPTERFPTIPSKSILEYCLETQSSKPWEILSESFGKSINVNYLCENGQPFFFHCFHPLITEEIREKIFSHSNLFLKSSQGETILFHLLHLYSTNPNSDYIDRFIKILTIHPLLLAQRNQHEQTIIEWIEFIPSTIMYEQYRPFYQAIEKILPEQLKQTSTIERFIYHTFGYDLLIFYRKKKLPMTTENYETLNAIKYNRGLVLDIAILMQAVRDNDLIKMKEIYKINPNIFLAKDSFGRACAHLAVLYQKYDILKWICMEDPDVINMKDNLLRTSFHYACLINDPITIEILETVNARQLIDCRNCTPNDYLINHPEEDLAKYQLDRPSNFSSNYLKIAFYPQLKAAIVKNSLEELKSVNQELIQMGFHLKDLHPNSSQQDYIQGKRYIPLFFLALEHRSYASFQFFRNLGIPLIGQLELSKSTIDENSFWQSHLSSTEEFQCLNLVDLMKNCEEEDIQWKRIFQENSSTVINVEGYPEKKFSTKNSLLQMISSLRKPNFQKCVLL